MKKTETDEFPPVPVILRATAMHLPAMLQAFNSKQLFTIIGHCKDGTNLVKLLDNEPDHYQVLVLLDSEIAQRSSGQLLLQLYRKFPGLRLIIILHSSCTLPDIIKFCTQGYNYFIRQQCIVQMSWRIHIMVDWHNYHHYNEHERLYKWLDCINELIVFSYLSVRYLQFLMCNKTRAEIIEYTGAGEEELDEQISMVSHYLNHLQLIEENLRAGIGNKLHRPLRILLC